MNLPLDDIHALAFESWVESANRSDSDFQIHNLSFERFRCPEAKDWRHGVVIMSGAQTGQLGLMLELSLNGKAATQLLKEEQRNLLEDRNMIVLRSHCARLNARRIGQGECGGNILPARP